MSLDIEDVPLTTCFTLAFYGIDATEDDLTAYYRRVTDWFKENKLSLDKISVHGRDFSGKVRSFARIHGRLLRSEFRNVESVHLYSMTDGGSIPVLHWNATSDILRANAVAVFSVDRDAVSWSDDEVLSFASVAVKLLRPSYGIGYCREKRLGPSLYAVGLVQGLDAPSGPEYEESHLISRWGDTAMPAKVYESGLQRDVYAMNFLTAPHLARRVQGSPLEEWIAENVSRGQLTRLGGGVNLWTVPDEIRADVRRALRDAGILYG